MTSPHREEASEPPTCWSLLVRMTASLPGGRTVSANTVGETKIPATEPKPEGLAMSTINSLRRQLAADLGTTPGSVLVDWFDFVFYDEPLITNPAPARPVAP